MSGTRNLPPVNVNQDDFPIDPVRNRLNNNIRSKEIESDQDSPEDYSKPAFQNQSNKMASPEKNIQNANWESTQKPVVVQNNQNADSGRPQLLVQSPDKSQNLADKPLEVVQQPEQAKSHRLSQGSGQVGVSPRQTGNQVYNPYEDLQRGKTEE